MAVAKLKIKQTGVPSGEAETAQEIPELNLIKRTFGVLL